MKLKLTSPRAQGINNVISQRGIEWFLISGSIILSRLGVELYELGSETINTNPFRQLSVTM